MRTLLTNRKTNSTASTLQAGPWLGALPWRDLSLPLALAVVWALVTAGAATLLPTQAASWLTFLAIVIAPGYLLGEMLAARLELDRIERLALAFPLGMAIVALPGMAAFLLHWTVDGLALGWALTTSLVVGGWCAVTIYRVRYTSLPPREQPWSLDEVALGALVALGVIVMLPALMLYKIDGDALAVGSFTADALAGLPLNLAEPLFGTTIGPGVRMAFNQSLPLAYLWSYWSGIDPITLTASASRPMIAVWAILAAYMLGRAAGEDVPGAAGGRRFALLLASIEIMIYLAAPFLRGDNVSLFFFERTTADKFMVPVTMLPVVFALAIRWLRGHGTPGAWGAWRAALAATFAVSAIHPLIAAMLALGLGAYSGFHWLMHLRDRAALVRSALLAALVVAAMGLPLVQLVLSRGEAPLAVSYPRNLAGWPVGYRLVPALPFIYVPTLDVYGPLPDLTQLSPTEVNATTDPFLVWRFAVNMTRRRLLLFGLDRYISDPNIVLEPPYLLALLLLPLLLPGIRRNLTAQFALSTTLAVLVVMFHPSVTPLIGSLVMPWILWRFVWLLPYALILALALAPGIGWLGGAVAALFARRSTKPGTLSPASYAVLATVVAVALVLTPRFTRTLQDMHERAAYPYYFPTPQRLLTKLDDLTRLSGPAMVMADQDLSVSIPAYVANAAIVAHRVPNTSEVFPATQQEDAIKRLVDQSAFFRERYLTADVLATLRRYDVRYVVAPSGSNLEVQLRLAQGWFTWIMDDQSYSLYAVHTPPTTPATVRGNTALAARQWDDAAALYEAALATDPGDLLALVGQAEIAHARGRFNDALALYEQALTYVDSPAVHFRMGELHTQLGQTAAAVSEFDLAQRQAPFVARYHVAAGDACLSAGDDVCAADQFVQAVANRNLPDDASELIALADLWRQRGRTDHSLALYEQAARQQPSEANQLMLASAYLEEAQYDKARALLRVVRGQRPLSSEVLALSAEVEAAQGEYGAAESFYRRAVWLLELTGQEASTLRLALARTLLAAGRTAEAQLALDRVLAHQPNNAAAYALQGDIHSAMLRTDQATVAYQKAFRLDPTQVPVYLALSNQFRQLGGQPAEMSALLETAIRANPDEPVLWLALGDQLQRDGETARAIDAYQAALDRFELASLSNSLSPRGSDSSRAYAYIRLASVSEDLGQIEPAMNYYGAAAAAAPDLPWTQVTYGDALRRRNDVAGAEAAYRRAITDDPSFANAYGQLAELLTANGNGVEASVLQQQALDVAYAQVSDPQPAQGQAGLSRPVPSNAQGAEFSPAPGEQDGKDSPRDEVDRLLGELAGEGAGLFAVDDGMSVLNLLTRLAQNSDDMDRVVDLYQRALDQGRREGWYPAVLAQYHKSLGDLYMAQGLPVLASELYRNAISLDAWWPQAQLGLARAFETLGQTDAALAQLEQAVAAAPGYAEASVQLADFYEQQGEAAQALELYRATAQAHPGNPLATLALAQAYQSRRAYEDAERAYRRTLALTPGNSEAYVELASLLLDQGRVIEAEPMLAAALETNQRNMNAHIQMAVLEQQRGNPDLAVEWFKRAVRMRPEGRAVSLMLIDLLQRYGHYDLSLHYASEALAQDPTEIEMVLRQARAYRLLANPGDALATLLGAARLNVSDARLSAELGEVYLMQGRPEAALAAYRQTVALDPGEEAYYIRLANLWQTQAEFSQAELTLRTGLTQARRPAAVYAALADLYLREGKAQQAKALLEEGMGLVGAEPALVTAMGAYYEAQAVQGVAPDDSAERWYTAHLADAPNDVAVLTALGDHLLRRNKVDDAIVRYEQAMELAPTDAGVRLAAAAAYTAANRPDDAAAALREALTLEPTAAEAALDLAAIYREQSRQDEAAAVYARGVAMIPTNGPLYVAYGDFFVAQGDRETGLRWLAQAEQASPTAAMLLARAAVYVKLDMNDAALADLQTARQKEPGSLDVMLALGDLYRDMGDTTNAQAVYAEATKLSPGLAAGRVRLARLSR